ncbi:hypothetical protein [Brevundimonas bacteroides]|uniref:hypothetical protein n=1 Tax=Brevundimonas bacteroides TaxID=74311 RepID=UPI0004967777|nr:hypothetical protein [Brevundimonas bacteroides]
MSRWASAAARLNRAADGFFGELVTILRPREGSAYVKGSADSDVVLQLQGVISEGEAEGPADGQTAGARHFDLQLKAGGIEASFMRTGFASRDQWPRKGDLIRVETGPNAGHLFETLDAAADDGDRVNAPVLRRS